ncbi:hypothetical protein AB0D59_25880 [Streptomyces sp. NPDC048417]|uniref:hypothetical protein n=1 Tax=Streptomyces sp. NPDC048417 TaxID=3155387 RepID=UPI00344AD008
MSDAPRLWKVVTALEATSEQVEALTDRFAETICPDPNHEGRCDTPWALHVTDGASLSAREQKRLQDEITDAMDD